jgi:hypothetical protein
MYNKMKFTNRLIAHLKKFGWEINRHDQGHDAYMTSNHYPKAIQEFMQLMGGLDIQRMSKNGEEVPDSSRVIFNISLTDGVDNDPDSYATFMGVELFPVGVYLPENYDICIDENECVYLIRDEVYCVGNKIYPAIEQILRGDFKDILELDPTNEDEPVWMAYDNEKSKTEVNPTTYQFNYDF